MMNLRQQESAESGHPVLPLQSINLKPLPVADLDNLLATTRNERDARVSAARAEMALLEQQISVLKLQRLKSYAEFTRREIAPMMLKWEGLRRKANLSFRTPSEAGRWLKNCKAAAHRRLKRLGQLDGYYAEARKLETSEEYRERDPYQAHLAANNYEFCKCCKRTILPGDWDAVNQLRYESEDSPREESRLLIVGHHGENPWMAVASSGEGDDYFARLAGED